MIILRIKYENWWPDEFFFLKKSETSKIEFSAMITDPLS